MSNIDLISKQLNKLEKTVKEGNSPSIMEMSRCLENILKDILSECHSKLKGKLKSELEQVEKNIANNTTYHQFTLGQLVKLWNDAEIPRKLCLPDLRNKNNLSTDRFKIPFDYTFVSIRSNEAHAEEQKTNDAQLKLYFYQLKTFFNNLYEDRIETKPNIKSNIPKNEKTFYGRENQLQEIFKNLSARNRNYLISITGIGGVGKSALAIEVARRCLEGDLPNNISSDDIQFDSYVWTTAKENHFYDNRTYQNSSCKSTLEEIILEIIRVLDPEQYGELPEFDRQRAKVLDLLNKYKVLLIVDNMETIQDERVMSFLKNDIAGTPATKVIVTDRRNVQTTTTISLPRLNDDEAENLINNELELYEIKISEDSKSELVRVTNGIPIVIMWSIGQIRNSDVETVINKIKNSDYKELSEFLFKTSYNNLTDNSKRILEFAAIPDTSVQGLMLSEWSGFIKDDVIDAIGELKRYALITEETEIIDYSQPLLNRTYSMLPLTRHFVLSHIKEKSEFEIKEKSKNIISKLLTHLKNIEDNPEWQSIDTMNYIIRFKDLFVWSINTSFHIQEYNIVNELMKYMGYPLQERGDHSLRVELAKLSIDAAQRCHNKLHEAECYVKDLSWTHFNHWHDYEKCKEYGEKGIDIAKDFSTVDGIRVVSIGKRNLGLLEKENKNYPKAESYLNEALGGFEKCGDRHFIAATYGALSSLYRDMQEDERAFSFIEKAISILEENRLKNTEGLMSVFLNKRARLCISLMKTDINLAEKHNNEALELSKRIGRQLGIAYSTLIKGLISAEKGKNTEARNYADEAEKLFVQYGSKEDIAEHLKKIREKCNF